MYVDSANARIFLKSRDPALLHKVLPGLVENVNWKGHNIAVDHNLDSTKILRNLGVNVPAPIRYEYEFPRPPHIEEPFAHQIVQSEFLSITRKGFLLSEMGTAKTASVLWAADYLMREGYVDKAIIVAPLSTLVRVWQEEIFNFIMHRTAVVLHGSAERRLELLNKRADFYIINYEGLDIIKGALRKRKDINLMVIDEVAAYRNSETERYTTLESILPQNDPKFRLWLLTGTPCPNAPTDAWALARLVNKAKVPMYFSTWKRKTMSQMTTHKWRPREGHRDMVYDVLQPAVRFAKKDCLDLPPVTYESRDCELTKEQKKAFDLMRQHMVTWAEDHQIDAVNAADKIGKLRQILCGSVKDPETGEYITLPHSPRLKVLLECIEQASAKVLVIVPFKGILRVLEPEVAKHHTCTVVNGDVTPKRRNEIFSQFKREEDPHVLLCHPQVMSHGLTLTEADMLIFYAPIYSNEQSQQVMERINRPGQKRKMTIIRMGANALEWEIYRQVEGKRVSQQSILDLYQTVLHYDQVSRRIGGSPARNT
jgi:SNF2 family DNA or RNA helicase